MKRTMVIGMAVAVSVAVAGAAFAAAKSTMPEVAKPVAPAAAAPGAAAGSFEQTKDFQKLDTGTQQAWQDAMKQGVDTRMDVIVRVDPPYDAGDRAFLEDHGMVVQMASGTLVRGHMPAQAMPSVASVPFVRSIGMAK